MQLLPFQSAVAVHVQGNARIRPPRVSGVLAKPIRPVALWALSFPLSDSLSFEVKLPVHRRGVLLMFGKMSQSLKNCPFLGDAGDQTVKYRSGRKAEHKKLWPGGFIPENVGPAASPSFSMSKVSPSGGLRT